MEMFRHRRSKSAGRADPNSSAFGFAFSNVPPQRGNKQTQRRRNAPKLVSDSSSRSSCGIPAQYDDLLTFELGHNSAKRVSKTPIKKLVAEEMVNETESRRRSPSIIARLMGLDGLPTQQAVHKQHKTVNCQQRTALLDSHRNAVSYDGHHQRKNSKEQQEFKDVYEVIEVPKVDSSGGAPLRRAESKRCTEASIEYIWQKFRDAKHLSMDEKLQDSKEFHDALEVLDSNKDLLLKFLQEPDYLFTENLHDLKGSHRQSHCSNITVIRSGNALKHKKKARESESGRETSFKGDKRSRKHLNGLLSHSYSRHDVHSSAKSKIQSEIKDGGRSLPTRIVVLKPNIGTSKDAPKSVSSPYSSVLSDYGKQMESPNVRHREADLWEKEKLCNDPPRSSRCKSREPRVNAKEITGRMRNGFNRSSITVSPSYKRGYAGDESSSSRSDNDSATESDSKTSTPRNCIDCKNHYALSSTHSSESSVNREAEKRLSEQWKMTQRFLDVGVISRGSTLGEMLSNCDGEMLKLNSDAIIGLEDSSSNAKTAGLVGPFGISSRDGWKDECIGNLSRSRSLPASSAALRSPQASMRQGAIVDDRHMMPNEAIVQRRNKAVHMNFNQIDGVSYRNLRSLNKKSRPRRAFRDSDGTLRDIYYRQNQVQSDFEDKGSSEQKSIFLETSPGSMVTDAASSVDDVKDGGNGDMTIVPEFPDNLLPEAPVSMVVKAMSSSCDVDDPLPQELSIDKSEQDSVALHCPAREPESPASSKEIDQPSPVSVLEVPLIEDPSSGCECFERVSADIQGLRMQLQLLKLGSDTFTEGPMFISSDDDAGTSEDKGRHAQDSLQSSYLVEVLNYCSFDDTDPDMFMADYSACPIGPWVFHELENKYCNQSTWLRCERKFLFDRINSGIVEILQLFMDAHPWVTPIPKRVHPKWDRFEVEDELCKLLASEQKKLASDVDAAEKVLGKESHWLNLRADIDVIGKEVEGLLIDELVTEVVTDFEPGRFLSRQFRAHKLY